MKAQVITEYSPKRFDKGKYILKPKNIQDKRQYEVKQRGDYKTYIPEKRSAVRTRSAGEVSVTCSFEYDKEWFTPNSFMIYNTENDATDYYDYENDILYFGESKFYKNVEDGLKAAMDSIKKHSNVEEISFVRNHTTSFIAENDEKRFKVIEKFETAYTEDISIKSIIFIINEDIYNKTNYEEVIIKYFGNIEMLESQTAEIILVFLPILSKEEFLEYFVRSVSDDKQ